jgi:hypothetical protein
MEWDKVRPNSGKAKITYKQMQVLHTPKNIILAGVPTNVNSDSLAIILRTVMEEACCQMVSKSPSKFGALPTTPKFALISDFVKHIHMPYEVRSDVVDPNPIPFWSKMPWHIECRILDEVQIEALLAYMDCTGCMLYGASIWGCGIPSRQSGDRCNGRGV